MGRPPPWDGPLLTLIDLAKDILQSLKVVFSEIEAAYPTVRGEEFDQLLNVNKKAFSSLVAAHV